MPVPNEDLVNLPNWLVLKLRIEGEEVLRLADVELLVLPPRVRHPQRGRVAHAALPRPGGSRDHAAQPALRQHGPRPPGRDRVDAHAGELVGPGRGHLGPRRPRHEPWRRALPGARGPAPGARVPADVRARGDRADGAHAPVADPRRAGGPHARLLGRRAGPMWSAGLHQMEDYIQQALAFDVTQGAPVRVEKMVALYTSHDRAISEPLGNAGKSVGDYPSFGGALAEPPLGVGRALGGVRPGPARERARAAAAAPSHRPRPAGLLAPHGRQGRRRRRARPERRGVPGPRVLGRAVRVPVPQLPPAADQPAPAPVPGAPAGGGPPGGAGGRLPRRDVPVAERQRRPGGDPGRPPQPALGALGAGPQPQPAPRERRDLLQRLALLPGDRRRRVHARPRGGDDARDRPLLVLARALQPRARPLRDPRGDGTRRVPREVPRGGGGRAAQQRLHQRHGRLDLRHRPGGARPAPGAPRQGAAEQDRAHRRRGRARGRR